jgi:hypothetical protein
MKKKEHYVNNRDFLDALVVYRNEVKKCLAEGKDKPKVPNYIGECFLKIATHLSYRPNFVNYMFKDDMICDGIENCLQYIDNFDPEKSTNPFAYFTQIIYFAFLRRIQKEKKQLEIKSKLLERSGFDEVFAADDSIMGFNMSDMNSIKENLEYRSYNNR